MRPVTRRLGGRTEKLRVASAERAAGRFGRPGDRREGKKAMVSRTSARKWGRIALGLALLPAMSALENRLWAQTGSSPAQFTAVRDSAPKDADAARDLMKRRRAALQAGD